MDYNFKNRGDVYPTHGIGPVCQALNIHRGDKMNYLVSFDTEPFRGREVMKRVTGKDGSDFKNGDHTNHNELKLKKVKLYKYSTM